MTALVLALAGASGVAFAGDPATPLGKWMKPNIGTPLAGQDFPTLQKNLDLVASKVPPGDYAQWAEFAKSGSAAAAKQDVKAVKASCKGCHDSYKEKYKKEFLTRPFP
ncbi:MAG: cytochrome c [Polyangiaceae bacterium]